MTARISPDHDGMAGRADDVYEALLAAHEGLGEAESAALNARLILLLCNALGDPDLAIAVINAARRDTKLG
jgi:hypothetical protein